MNDYTINYDDERFKNVQAEQAQKESELINTYDNMVNQSDQFYQNQINAVKDYEKTQQDIQNQQTNLAIEQINNEKAKAEKDYLKEQQGAYVDYTKQSNKYGANAEQMASNGLTNTGYSESSIVSMYNTYQNRVSTARESFNQAVVDYNMAIKEAQLSNNAALAEIAYKSLQSQLELGLNGFQYKNQLLLDKTNALQNINNTYYARYQDVLSQMNNENSLAEQIRQYNEKMAYQKERDAVADAQWQKEYNLAKSSKSSGGSSGGSKTSYAITGTPIVGDTEAMQQTESTSQPKTFMEKMKTAAELVKALGSSSAPTTNKTTSTTTNKTTTTGTTPAQTTSTSKTQTLHAGGANGVKTYTAVKSVSLSSSSATNWYNNNIKKNEYNELQLLDKLNTGVKNGNISISDKNKILSAFGL